MSTLYIEVRRTWRERLFSLTPWRKTKRIAVDSLEPPERSSVIRFRGPVMVKNHDTRDRSEPTRSFDWDDDGRIRVFSSDAADPPPAPPSFSSGGGGDFGGGGASGSWSSSDSCSSSDSSSSSDSCSDSPSD